MSSVTEIGTLIIASIGTLSSIAIYLDRKWSTTRKLKVWLQIAYHWSEGSKMEISFLTVNIGNPGLVDSTINSIMVGYKKNTILFHPDKIRGYEKLPLKLKPGESEAFQFDYETLLKSFDEGQIVKIHALCTDSLNNRYSSKPIKLKKKSNAMPEPQARN